MILSTQALSQFVGRNWQVTGVVWVAVAGAMTAGLRSAIRCPVEARAQQQVLSMIGGAVSASVLVVGVLLGGAGSWSAGQTARVLGPAMIETAAILIFLHFLPAMAAIWLATEGTATSPPEPGARWADSWTAPLLLGWVVGTVGLWSIHGALVGAGGGAAMLGLALLCASGVLLWAWFGRFLRPRSPVTAAAAGPTVDEDDTDDDEEE